jgi:hypothetical protein
VCLCVCCRHVVLGVNVEYVELYAFTMEVLLLCMHCLFSVNLFGNQYSEVVGGHMVQGWRTVADKVIFLHTWLTSVTPTVTSQPCIHC